MRRAAPLFVALAAIASLLAAGTRAHADEEADTQAPAASPTPQLRMEAGGMTTDGSEARARELLRTPDSAWWSVRWASPLREGPWDGTLSTAFRSTEEGAFSLAARSTHGDRVRVRAARTRSPRSFRIVPGGFIGGDTTQTLETAREEVGASWERRMGRTVGALDLGWSSLGGSRPALPAGFAFDDAGSPVPVTASSHRGSASALRVQARVQHLLGSTRLHGAVRLRDGRARDTLRVVDANGESGLRLSKDDRSQGAELVAGAEAPLGRALHVGGSAATGWTLHRPTGDRTFALASDGSRSFETNELEQRVLRQRAQAGAVWSPAPAVRTGVRIGGSTTSSRGDSLESRHLATEQIATGHSSDESRAADMAGEADWYLGPRLRLSARAGLGIANERDAWSLVRTLPDGTTTIGARRERVDRTLTASNARVEATTSAGRRTRVSAGVSTERRMWDVEPREQLETRTLGDLDWQRDAVFGSARVRIAPGFAADLRGSVFQEVREAQGLSPRGTGTDVRARLTAARGPGSFFFAVTIADRAMNPPLEFAAIEDWRMRSRGASAGGAWALGRASLSARGALSTFEGDSEAHLADGSVSVAFPLSRAVSGSATARVLDARDRRWGPGHAQAAVASFALHGNF